MQRKIQFEPGKIYHIYNRGVAKCKICEDEGDFWRFLQGLCLFNDHNSASNILWQLERDRGRVTLNVLKDYIKNQRNKRKPLVRILAYCIKPNHFHLLVEELEEGGIVKFMHKLGTGYVGYFNNKHNRVGGLFQGRFQAVPVEDERHLLYLLVYINVINPGQLVEPDLKEEGIKDIQKILQKAEEYLWGTHQEYIGKRGSIIIEKGVLAELLPTPEAYRKLVESVLRDKKYTEISHLLLE
jgi:putative transposase